MLPVEAFAEVIALLRLFDLNALAITNATCSSLAVKASASIRWEDFPGLEFVTMANKIVVGDSRDQQLIVDLSFPSENDRTEFIAAAFPNCVFEDLVLLFPKEHLLEALGRVADSVVVKETLFLASSRDHDDSLKVVRKFRKVKALLLGRAVSDDEANKLAIFYRGSGIEELRYYRSYEDSSPKKLKMF